MSGGQADSAAATADSTAAGEAALRLKDIWDSVTEGTFDNLHLDTFFTIAFFVIVRAHLTPASRSVRSARSPWLRHWRQGCVAVLESSSRAVLAFVLGNLAGVFLRFLRISSGSEDAG